MRTITVILAALILAGALPAQEAQLSREQIIARCPTLARLFETGQVHQLQDPVFSDPAEAKSFGKLCRKVVAELDEVALLPGDMTEIRQKAELVGEFLQGDAYDLSTSEIGSVIKLREWVKVAPPEGLVYVRKYQEGDKVPEQVSQAFAQMSERPDGAKVQGITIYGRYIAVLHSKYHDELVDTIAHELVHAYITLASPRQLPRWFQEGAAVYFSTGKDTKLYGITGDPVMRQVTLPEDYKTRLYSFQYIEKKAGRPKLFQFVRDAVDTGKPKPREALGLAQPPKPFKPPIFLISCVVGGVAILFGGAWYISNRRELAD